MREIQAWAYQHVGNTAAEAELWDIVGRMLADDRAMHVRELCELMISKSLSTGHGDDFASVIDELSREIDSLREKVFDNGRLDENRACAKLLDDRARIYHETALQWQKRAGERADEDARRMGIEYAIRHAVAAENAAAIRARGETPDKTA